MGRQRTSPEVNTTQAWICLTCGRPFDQRAKWRSRGQEVKYCSTRCRNTRPSRAERERESRLKEAVSREIKPLEEACLEAGYSADQNGLRQCRWAARRLAHRGEVTLIQRGQSVEPGYDRGPLHLTALLTIFLIMSACLPGCDTNNGKPDWTSEYLTRFEVLSQKLNLKKRSFDLQSLRQELSDSVYPRVKATRFAPVPPVKMDLRSLWGIGSCEIGRLIAFRNSPLGRSMLPAQRLIYESRFLSQAPACLLDSTLTATLRKDLSTAVQHKRSKWMERWSDAVWGGIPMRSVFSKAWLAGRPPSEPSVEFQSKLRWLAELKPEDVEVWSAHLEKRLKELPPYVGGKVLTDVAEAMWFLREGDEALQAVRAKWVKGKIKEEDLCKSLLTLWQAYAKLQIELSRRHQAWTLLAEAYVPVIDRYSSPSPSHQQFVDAWLKQKSARPTKLKTVMRSHVDHWTALRQQTKCPQVGQPVR